MGARGSLAARGGYVNPASRGAHWCPGASHRSIPSRGSRGTGKPRTPCAARMRNCGSFAIPERLRPCAQRNPEIQTLPLQVQRLWIPDSRQAGAPGMTLISRRRLDQLDRVVAGPFGGAGDGGDLAALAVDQHRGRHAQGPADALKILKNLGFLVGEIAEPGQIGLFQEVLRLSGSRVSILIATTSKSLPPSLACNRPAPASPSGRARTRWPTGSAARSSAPVGELFRLAVGVLEGEVGQPQRRRGHGQRGDLAMGQRRDLFRQIDRGGAGADRRACASGRRSRIPRPIRSGADRDAPSAIGMRRARRSAGRGAFGHIVCHPVSDTAMQGLLQRSNRVRLYAA